MAIPSLKLNATTVHILRVSPCHLMLSPHMPLPMSQLSAPPSHGSDGAKGSRLDSATNCGATTHTSTIHDSAV